MPLCVCAFVWLRMSSFIGAWALLLSYINGLYRLCCQAVQVGLQVHCQYQPCCQTMRVYTLDISNNLDVELL